MSASLSSHVATAIAPIPAEPADRSIERLRQSVLKGVDWQQPVGAGPVLSDRAVDAILRLIAMLKQLRLPTGGWPKDVPPTPEHLVAYVSDEAQDVLEALQSSPMAEQGTQEGDGQPYLPTEELADWLLWTIARSTYGTMRLLEGIPARVLQGEIGWQTGIARLVPTLQVALEGETIAFDLATRSSCPPLLSSQSTLQTDDPDLGQEPTWVRDFLQRLAHQVQATTPALASLFTGTVVSMLMPHAPWQQGTLHLQLGLEFQPDTEGEMLDPIPERPFVLGDGSVTDAEFAEIGSEAIASMGYGRPLLRFTDADWLHRYQQQVTRQYLTTVLPYLPSVLSSSPDPLTQLVQDACVVSDLIDQSPVLASRNLPQREWSLTDLNLRLLWCISRGGYGVTRLMAGIPCAVMQPGQDWVTGVLRLRVNLAIATPELDWQMDLVRGDGLEPNAATIGDDALVRSLDPHGYPLQRVDGLYNQVMQQVQRMTPELDYLLDGTEIDLMHEDDHWQPGVVQLRTRIEFTPG